MKCETRCRRSNQTTHIFVELILDDVEHDVRRAHEAHERQQRPKHDVLLLHVDSEPARLRERLQ